MSRLTIGLTGGIASGKSAVAQAFEHLGVPVLDADRVSREIVIPPSVTLDAIVSEFGSDFLQADGTLDRRRLRVHAFADADARRRLEQITHPAIRQRLRRWRDSQTAPYCVLAAAILLESGMATLVDRVLVVDTPENVQKTRLAARDNVSATLADQMISAQLSRTERLARADDVIENTSSLEQLRAQVARLHSQYLNLPRPTP